MHGSTASEYVCTGVQVEILGNSGNPVLKMNFSILASFDENDPITLDAWYVVNIFTSSTMLSNLFTTLWRCRTVLQDGFSSNFSSALVIYGTVEEWTRPFKSKWFKFVNSTAFRQDLWDFVAVFRMLHGS
jgi:hypothetical protein